MAAPPRTRPQAAPRAPLVRAPQQVARPTPRAPAPAPRHQPQPSVAAASSLFGEEAPSDHAFGMTKSPTWLESLDENAQCASMDAAASQGPTQAASQQDWAAHDAQPAWDQPGYQDPAGEYDAYGGAAPQQDYVDDAAYAQYDQGFDTQQGAYAQPENEGFVDDAQYDQYLDDAQYDQYGTYGADQGQEQGYNEWYAHGQAQDQQGPVQGLGVDIGEQNPAYAYNDEYANEGYAQGAGEYDYGYDQQQGADDGFLDPSQYETEFDQAWGQEGEAGAPATYEPDAQGEQPADAYAQGEQAPDEYAQGDAYDQGDYAQGDYAEADYAQGDYAQGLSLIHI